MYVYIYIYTCVYIYIYSVHTKLFALAESTKNGIKMWKLVHINTSSTKDIKSDAECPKNHWFQVDDSGDGNSQ